MANEFIQWATILATDATTFPSARGVDRFAVAKEEATFDTLVEGEPRAVFGIRTQDETVVVNVCDIKSDRKAVALSIHFALRLLASQDEQEAWQNNQELQYDSHDH